MRRCVGLGFASLEMKLAIAKMLTGFEFDLVTTQDVISQRRGLVSGSNRKIEMTVRKRQQQLTKEKEQVAVG